MKASSLGWRMSWIFWFGSNFGCYFLWQLRFSYDNYDILIDIGCCRTVYESAVFLWWDLPQVDPAPACETPVRKWIAVLGHFCRQTSQLRFEVTIGAMGSQNSNWGAQSSKTIDICWILCSRDFVVVSHAHDCVYFCDQEAMNLSFQVIT